MNIKIIFLAFAFLLCLKNAADENYIQTMIQRGFPRDYAEKLDILHRKYPQWHFEPLPVTKMAPNYTWHYVLSMETENMPSRSLISGNKPYAAYFHPHDTREYDAGCRRASTDAVAYFLDPRNYLNECDIFQFKDLRYTRKIQVRAVKSALQGTFMATELLENGISYAKYLCLIAHQLDIDPVFLAVRLRQEQGINGTALISGKCGSLLSLIAPQNKTINNCQWLSAVSKKILWIFFGGTAPSTLPDELLQYDGLYNFFNINAAGNGKYTILLNGMKEAQTGTPEMAEYWDFPQWDKKWKAIYGGALKISLRYIGNHQNTIYLQKWNIDPRSRTPQGYSRNFWGQYMQNIGAAFSESRNFYRTLKKHRLLSLPHRFLIPVYDDMPPAPAPDPANGSCHYYRSCKFQHNQ